MPTLHQMELFDLAKVLYLDMDDVVADWQGAAERFLGRTWAKETERLPEAEWNKIRSHSRFYRDLPLKPGAEQLVQYCRAALAQGKVSHVAFLSAIPHQNDMPWAVQDKVHWAEQHFPGIPVFLGPYSYDKHRHCRPGDILIDDRESNILEWRAAGGRGHIYTEIQACIAWLDKELDVSHLGK